MLHFNDFSPQTMPQTLNENDRNYNASTTDCIDDELVHLFPDNYEDRELESQWKTISMEEYKRLVQLIPEVAKYRNSSEQKEKIIKSKDSQLKVLQRSLERNWINISNLSDVSISALLLTL